MDGPNNDNRPINTTPPTNGRHFECGQCGKCFGQSSTLPTHLLIHNEPRPWSITADQGYLWPTLTNLDPSEELRFLRARIAKLERSQAMNLPASSSAGLDLVAQNKNGLMAAHQHSHAAAAGCGVATGMLQHPQQQQQQQHQQNAAMLQHPRQQQHQHQQNAAILQHPQQQQQQHQQNAAMLQHPQQQQQQQYQQNAAILQHPQQQQQQQHQQNAAMLQHPQQQQQQQHQQNAAMLQHLQQQQHQHQQNAAMLKHLQQQQHQRQQNAAMLQHLQQQQQQQHQQNAAMLQHPQQQQQQQQQNAAFVAHPMAAAFAAQVQLAAAAQQQHLQHNAAGAGAVTAPVVTAAAAAGMSADALVANQQQVAAVLANAIVQLQKQQDLLFAEQTMLKARRDALIGSQLEKTASAGPTGGTQPLLQQPAKLGASYSLQMGQFARPSTSANSQRRPRTRGGRKYQERKAKAMRIQAELAVVQNEDVVKKTSYLQKKRCFFARCAEKKKAAKAARAAKKAVSAKIVFGRE